ncbi:AraC family transcriptional regulator [Variovorax sp. ZS18.2.2]|uniref:AraC family transcriptional regulator n=1 Tax=Variovorax sp. ZS18.2.2 TaxID=2971255 RepID=UPI002151A814|nr:AraC family transcriptional regulator [Variovorax sp. ZS18.2.2]MCR6480060.1 AraC family transcriptional regulator [Variovorax sp. ZS18.2.2]
MEDPSHARPDALFESELARNVELGREPSGGIGCYVHGTPSRLERWHYHDEYELQLVVQTSGRTYVGNHVGAFQPGSVVLIGPRVPHNIVSLDAPAAGVNERSVVIHFARDLMHKAAELLAELQGAVSLLDRDRCGIEFLNADRDLHDGFRRVQDTSGVARFCALAELLQRLDRWPECRFFSSTSPPDGRSQRKAVMDPRVERVQALVYQNYADRLSLTKAGDCAGVSAYAFSRLFRRVTGSTYTDFLINVRVARACEMLSKTDVQVASICYMVGFNNISNFNRHFRRLKHMTPSEYRSRMSGRFGAAAAEGSARAQRTQRAQRAQASTSSGRI